MRYDAAGNLTVFVILDDGNTLSIPASMPPAERDDLITAFKADQQALANAS
ncbi:hypothetical protein [Agrobacterium sp. SORGH_AS 787]|uniref:hypothetical protein n=1 Tax=Agrobacterium sp. SORGH_AS 787 TaxID=3041775 RepID=UPI002784B6A8|nr:hypothetical protein [Rhizobium sp. SORGH_AS_0787]